MKCRPKNQNKVKLKMGVHRSSVYRSRKQKTKLEGDKNNGSKFYVNPKAYEAQRVLHPDSTRHAQGVKNTYRYAGPRDVSDVVATYLHALPEAAVVDDASDIEDESFDE
ncbi:hypothetical protein AM587_10001226 [Phytophthora nicotianae]|uniref:Uncharacterized protein n=1 Tax=Phytophthora nicotianae TaxID=4792 RepID=A0A0W8CE19_PHYNI|nr:hypothetical protein AM587_10001226 [Phytophthora nicotianae]